MLAQSADESSRPEGSNGVRGEDTRRGKPRIAPAAPSAPATFPRRFSEHIGTTDGEIGTERINNAVTANQAPELAPSVPSHSVRTVEFMATDRSPADDDNLAAAADDLRDREK